MTDLLEAIEKAASLVVGFTLAALPLMLGGAAVVLLALQQQGPGAYLAAACVTAGSVPAFVAPVLALFRWSRTGRARPFLAAIRDEVGGEVRTATWLWSLVSPRLSGTLDGAPFRLTLQRTAGVLSPSTVGRRFLLWGWTFDLRLEAPIGVRVSFWPGETPIGAGLMGLWNPVPCDGITAFAGTTERGRELVARDDVIDAARAILDRWGHPVLVRAGPAFIHVAGNLHRDVTPADLVTLLRGVAALAAALRAT